jgi:hypothetical protein
MNNRTPLPLLKIWVQLKPFGTKYACVYWDMSLVEVLNPSCTAETGQQNILHKERADLSMSNTQSANGCLWWNAFNFIVVLGLVSGSPL